MVLLPPPPVRNTGLTKLQSPHQIVEAALLLPTQSQDHMLLDRNTDLTKFPSDSQIYYVRTFLPVRLLCQHSFGNRWGMGDLLGADLTVPVGLVGLLATIPNPNLCTPMPNLATSGPESFCAGVDGLEGGVALLAKEVGLMGSGFFNSTSSAPHFSIRSASSFAAFSASSNEMGSAGFLAASLVGFLAPRTPVRRAPVDDVVFVEALNAEEVVVLGAAAADSTDKFELFVVVAFPFVGVPVPFAGEGVRPRTGGVAVREGGGVGL